MLVFSFFSLVESLKKCSFRPPELYGETLGQQPSLDRQFVELRKRVDRESRNLSQLMQLQGAVDLVLSASRAHEAPRLRSEEEALRRRRREAASSRRRRRNSSGGGGSSSEAATVEEEGTGLVLDKILAE